MFIFLSANRSFKNLEFFIESSNYKNCEIVGPITCLHVVN